MLLLCLGIVVFLGAHTVPAFPATRGRLVALYGETRFKSLYSIVSLLGLVLIIAGFSRYRDEGLIQVWYPPLGINHLTILLMWLAFICLASMGRKPGRIRGWLRHPMLVAIKIWALAHLLANGDAGGMLLFGSFLAWAVFDRIAVKRRGDLGAPRISSFTRADMVAVGAGTVAWVAMIFLHPILIGVSVLGQ